MNELQKQVSAIGCVPVIKLNNPQRDAAPLSDALCAPNSHGRRWRRRHVV